MDSERHRIVNEWFSGRVGVAWGGEHTRVRDGCLLLGALEMTDRPSFAVAFLAHEMAHLVEIDARRATEDDFGLRYKRVVRLPPTRYSSGICADPRTAQGVERECMVVAISTQILRALAWSEEEIRDDVERTIAALRHMQDWRNIPGKRSDEARREWCRRKVARALPQWPMERVRAEWWRKVVLVTKRLERAERRAR
jgi:hypothetical protein